MTRRRARFTARRFARSQQQLKIDRLKPAVASPIVEIALHVAGEASVPGEPLDQCFAVLPAETVQR
jgi:hypothetical protein